MYIKRSRKIFPNLASLVVLISCLTPVYSNSMVNQTVKEGDNVTFECDVVSEKRPHIVWFHHLYKLNWTDPSLDKVLNSNTSFDDSNILQIHNVQTKNQGWYTCIAANATAKTITSAYLTVLLDERPPLFEIPDLLEDQLHTAAGRTIRLSCFAFGRPTPNITWTRNNKEIKRLIGKVTYRQWFIEIDDVISEDSGIYKCTVCNALGCIEHSTNVIVSNRLLSKPVIRNKLLQNQTVLANSSTYMECSVVPDIKPHIVWFKYAQRNQSIEKLEKRIPNIYYESIPQDVVILDRDSDKPNILNFTKVSHEDEGWYTCVAANNLGQTVASAYLKVVDKLPSTQVLQRTHHTITIISVAVIVVSLLLLGTIYVMRNLKRKKLLKQRIDTIYQWTKKVTIYKPPPPSSEDSSYDLQIPIIKIEKQRSNFTTNSNLDRNQGFSEYEFPWDPNWERPRSQLSLGSTLGEGAFGRVVMAQISPNSSDTTIVAVKMVKDEHTDADVISLVREMEVMKMIGNHINILNLLGCCTQNGPLWVIVEYAVHGNLKDFLKKNRPLSGWDSNGLKHDSNYLDGKTHLTEKHLISFAFQIARGMEYLASRKCIHRDLAARNVLVTEDYVMKIADFGLARDIQDADYYRKTTNGLLPIKWMALESLLEQYYDSQSDVWSYGILLWEIMTYGEQPYPNIMSAEELYNYLITGQRMEKPPHCSLNIYMLMRQCWHFDATARPTFSEIAENLDKILELTTNTTTTNVEYVEMAMPEASSQPSDGESDSEKFQENSLRYQNTSLIKNC